MIYTFLVLGASGNLAKLKVLPGIGEFASTLDSKENEVHVVGYARSKVTKKDLENSLTTLSKDLGSITSVSAEQGDYESIDCLDGLADETDEEHQLYIYLALPPSAYLEILQQIAMLNHTYIKVFVEKPFGVDQENSLEIDALIANYHLYESVLFTDHYLFKSALSLAPQTQTTLQNIQSVTVTAFETIGVEERLGYYKDIGAVKDMSTHMLNLTTMSIYKITNTSARIQSINIESAELGVYESIQSKLSPAIPTLFTLEGVLKINGSSIAFKYASGKKLSQKLTEVCLETLVGNYTFCLAPTTNLQTPEGTLEYKDQVISDHTRMFLEVSKGNYDNFLGTQEALNTVELEASIAEQLLALQTKVISYKEGISVT